MNLKKRGSDLNDPTWPSEKRMKIKRSGTNLLGNIREEHKIENKPGVVPKDLGLGLLRDLIELSESEEEQSDWN